MHKCFIEASAESDVNFIYSPECLQCMLPPSTHVSTITPGGLKPTRLVKIYSHFSAVHVPHASASSVLSKRLPLWLLLHSDGTEGARAYSAGTQEPGAPRRWDNCCFIPPNHVRTQTFPPGFDLFANGKPHQLEPQIGFWMIYLPVASLLKD